MRNFSDPESKRRMVAQRSHYLENIAKNQSEMLSTSFQKMRQYYIKQQLKLAHLSFFKEKTALENSANELNSFENYFKTQ